MEVCQRVGSVVETRLYGDQACPHLVVEGMFGSASVLSDIYEHIYLFTLINLCIKVQL